MPNMAGGEVMLRVELVALNESGPQGLVEASGKAPMRRSTSSRDAQTRTTGAWTTRPRQAIKLGF
jgi:hypothetical protein